MTYRRDLVSDETAELPLAPRAAVINIVDRDPVDAVDALVVVDLAVGDLERGRNQRLALGQILDRCSRTSCIQKYLKNARMKTYSPQKLIISNRTYLQVARKYA